MAFIDSERVDTSVRAPLDIVAMPSASADAASPILYFSMEPDQAQHYRFLGYPALERAAALVNVPTEGTVLNSVAIVSSIKSHTGSDLLGGCYPVGRDGVRRIEAVGKSPQKTARSALRVNEVIFHELRHAQHGRAAVEATLADHEVALKAKPFGRVAIIGLFGFIASRLPGALALLPNAAQRLVVEKTDRIPLLSEMVANNPRALLIGAVALAAVANCIRPLRELGAKFAFNLVHDILNLANPYERDARKAEKFAARNPIVVDRKKS